MSPLDMYPLKVLISAYACRPGKGSEPGVGWNLARELAQHHCVWVITRANNRAETEAYLRQHPIPQLTVIYCTLPAWVERLNHQQRWVHAHYYLWQIAVYFTVRQLHAIHHFDLVHHVTYVRYSSPSFLALLPIPFVWGPVGGGESAPAAFWQDFDQRAQRYEQLRNLARRVGEFDPFVRLTARRSVLARATTEETAQRLRALGASQVEVYSQLGLCEAEITELADYADHRASNRVSEEPPRFLSIGRLLHWKGFHLGLRAFAIADLPSNTEYWIVGDGPERDRLQSLAQSLGIAQRVKFWGELSREKTLEMLAHTLALIHPSLHESGGLVCLEAMAAQCPVICLALGGPAIQVTDATGIKIPADSPAQAVQDIAAAISQLANTPELAAKLGQRAQQRVRNHYHWATKAAALAKLYPTLLPVSPERPSAEAGPILSPAPVSSDAHP